MFLSHCISPYYMPWFPQNYTEDYANIYITRLSVFFITGVCAGVPALIWAFRIVCLSSGRISPIAIFLLVSDLLELLLNPVFIVMSKEKKEKENFAACIFVVLIGVRLCGHQLHQLVALESILTLKYPSFAHFFSPNCSYAVCIIVFLVGNGFQFIPNSIIYLINIFLCVLPVIVCALTCLVSCKASPDANQPTDRKPEVLVLSVAMFTLIILNVPFFLTIFAGLPFMLDCLASMRLISDIILCGLIYRETHMVKAAHTDTPKESTHNILEALLLI